MDPAIGPLISAGGSKFGYTLLSVHPHQQPDGMFLQAPLAKLGIATGRDLAQACREQYSRRTGLFLWVVCEIAIAACDLARCWARPSLKLLFGSRFWPVSITALDVLIVLALQGRAFA